MEAGAELTPSEYIQHHLSFFTKPISDGAGFWAINVDSLSVSILLGIIGLGFLWWMARRATTGVPGKLQAFVEFLIYDFIDKQVAGIFHGDRNRFVVPTADVNTTFALSISVLVLSVAFAISVKGLGGWLHELFFAPFGSHPLLIPANFLFQMVEYISKTLSHSLRLFGNMYAGEILFLLLWLWAAHSGLKSDLGIFWLLSVFLGVVWAVFHILIVLLQAYIFMMLTVVYISMAQEHH